MRVSNLSTSEQVTSTIRQLEQDRIRLNAQISSGQKITLPEDDGLRMGRVITLDTEKSTLSQYQRNASYASEFLNAGHLNLDHFHKLNTRGQEIVRLAGTGLNATANETYAYEINELVEEALNRLNAKHRDRALFGGTQLKPEFGSSIVERGESQTVTFSLDKNLVGASRRDGQRSLITGEQVILQLNGREYVVEAKTDGLLSNELLATLKNLINNDKGTLAESPIFDDENANFKAFVRPHLNFVNLNDPDLHLIAKVTPGGELEVAGNVGKKFSATAQFVHRWDPNFYFPEQLNRQLDEEANARYPGSGFQDLGEMEQEIVRFSVFSSQKMNELFDSEAESIDEIIEGLNYQTLLSIPHVFEFSDAQIQDLTNNDELSSGLYTISTNPLSGKYQLEAVGENENGFYKMNPQENHVLTITNLPEFLVENKSDILKARFDSGDYLGYNDLDGAAQEMVRNAFFDNLVLREQFLNAVPDKSSTLEFTDLSADQQAIIEQKVFSGDWINDQLALETELQFPGESFQSLSSKQQDLVRSAVFAGYITRELSVDQNPSEGMVGLNIVHADNWRRLDYYYIGDVVQKDGILYESKTDLNFNHDPANSGATYWRELPSGYDQRREDWEIKVVGEQKKPFYMAPDGKLFTDEVDAENHYSQYIFSKMSPDDPLYSKEAEADVWPIRKVFLGVGEMEANGSNHQGHIAFDPETMHYRLSAVPKDGQIYDGLFIKGNILEMNEVESILGDPALDSESMRNQVVSFQGKYYLITEPGSLDTEIFEDLQLEFPPTGVVHTFYKGESLEVARGEHVLHSENEVNTYYLASENVSLSGTEDLSSVSGLAEITARSDGNVFLLGDHLPTEGKEIIFEGSDLVSVEKGDYVYDPEEDLYYVALKTPSDPVAIGEIKSNSSDFRPVGEVLDPGDISVRADQQGMEWSYDSHYDYNQIVLFEGKYYQRIDYTGGNSALVRTGAGSSSEIVTIKPNDEEIPLLDDSGFVVTDSANNTVTVPNNRWIQVGEPLDHVLMFEVEPDNPPEVSIPLSGRAGVDAKAKAVIDANGQVVGLKIEDRGRYFFGLDAEGNVPPQFDTATILTEDGTKLSAKIIWGSDSNDPGPFKVTGFVLDETPRTGVIQKIVESREEDYVLNPGDQLFDPEYNRYYVANTSLIISPDDLKLGSVGTYDPVNLSERIHALQDGAEIGDTFSFATGTKTFLDHRDEEGNIKSVTYMGSDENSEFFIGKDSKVSSFLSAEGGNTKELASSISAMIDLREGLMSQNPAEANDLLEGAEQTLLAQENTIINSMGQISASLVRMETVRAHDEDYFMEIDKRVSRDLDLDLSEAIMRLTRVSTAYQAAMQVGAQLLNNSLLNYL